MNADRETDRACVDDICHLWYDNGESAAIMGWGS